MNQAINARARHRIVGLLNAGSFVITGASLGNLNGRAVSDTAEKGLQFKVCMQMDVEPGHGSVFCCLAENVTASKLLASALDAIPSTNRAPFNGQAYR